MKINVGDLVTVKREFKVGAPHIKKCFFANGRCEQAGLVLSVESMFFLGYSNDYGRLLRNSFGPGPFDIVTVAWPDTTITSDPVQVLEIINQSIVSNE